MTLAGAMEEHCVDYRSGAWVDAMRHRGRTGKGGLIGNLRFADIIQR